MYNSIVQEPIWKAFREELAKASSPVCVTGLAGSRKAQITAELSRHWTLYIAPDEREATGIQSDLSTYVSNVWIYPAKDLLFFASDIHGNFIRNQRADARRHLLEDSFGVLVTTVDALMDKIPSRESATRSKCELREGLVVPVRELIKILNGMGYERVAQIEAMGQFAVRGGIVDIYPVTEEFPIRVEFFDDEIDTIRPFDPETQRSTGRTESIEIYPASEGRKGDVSILDYFGKNDLIVADDPVRLKAKAELTETEFLEAVERRKDKRLNPDADENEVVEDIFSAAEIMERIAAPGTVYLAALDDVLKEFGAKKAFHFNTSSAEIFRGEDGAMAEELRRYEKDMYRMTVMTPSHTRTGRLAESLREQGFRAYVPDEHSGELQPGCIEVVYGTLRQGFSCPDIRYVLFTETDMFGRKKNTKKHRNKNIPKGEKVSSLEELSVGDYVVHESHGIGVYKGISRIERDDTVRDYIHLEYADGGSLFLPATRLDLVQKYAGGEGRRPKVNKLNGTEWQRTRDRVRKAVDDLARELVELYAKRSVLGGFKCGPDTVWQREFEELFPFEETEDQMNAIEAVKRDMESGRIMDRLVCGDVGYGKTEIALRAAFKAVQEGKQVAYLVPTTVLAKQHYRTFEERMKNFPVKVEMMCRFRSAAENKKIAQKVNQGLVDIVIGTHRILSSDVKFKDLGLLIIDEEQRFGVAHKEKIKKLKTDVDVLVLTATPIPRTLHMSLTGIRDMSVLEEPPFDRVPIQTYVMEYDDEMVREAISREITRNGQVYYVFNRVNGIEEKTDRLRQLLPDARIEYAHGQMNEHELENIMMDFVEGNIDVLVSTTIIETGLDIPNANTLIIDGAERLGLSQMYQIRGRVGRSNRTSYAFLMYRKDKVLSEEAEKRLKAIREFTEFGSGIKIAMRDLEIRGAGNVLGAEQSGQMEAVGYDLYCKLLKKAVRLLSGIQEKREEFTTAIDCDIDAYIPEEYIKSEYQKLDIYKRISVITNEEQYLDMQDELVDRFGDIPEEVMNLLRIALTKAKAHDVFVTELNIRRDGFDMLMWPRADINVDAIPDLVAAENGKLRLQQGSCPRFIYQDDRTVHPDARFMLERAMVLIDGIRKP